MITEKPHYNLGISPRRQLLYFLLLTFLLLSIGYAIGAGIIYLIYGAKILTQVNVLNLNSAQAVSAMWILQIASATIPIFLTPVVFAKWVVKEPGDYLKTNTPFPPALLLIVFSIMVMSSPIMEVLIMLNEKMVLPDFLRSVENWMRASEEAAQRVTKSLLQMNTWWDAVKAVLIVGLATAIAEEFMFRGCLQTIFTRWTKNSHTAIWITAILFSAFHMEFYGFLPRLMLGVFFGYFAAWSGSIWPAVWAHFLNNGTAVVMTYLYQHKQIDMNPDEQYSFNYSLYILSIIITVALFLNYRNTALQKKDHQPY